MEFNLTWLLYAGEGGKRKQKSGGNARRDEMNDGGVQQLFKGYWPGWCAVEMLGGPCRL